MRRTMALLLAPLSLFACSFFFEATREASQATLTLDETTAEQRFEVRICWTGEAEVSESSVRVHAWTPDGANRVELRIDDEASEEPWAVQATRPEDTDAPRHFWWSDAEDEPEDACTEGTIVSFALLDPSAGPVELEWAVIGSVGSDIDDAVEDLELEISVEPL
jgi:hypothetical protein